MLDLDGDLVLVESRREFQRSELVFALVSCGRPAVVATDVSPAPSAVEKLAATFGAAVYSPDRTLTVEEKTALVRDVPAVTDSHRRDALACALKAYSEVRQTVERVDRKSREAGLDDALREEVRVRVVRGECRNIDDAIREATAEADEVRRLEAGAPAPQRAHLSRALRREVELLRSYKDHLEGQVAALERRASELERELGRARSEGERRALATRAARSLKGRIRALAARLADQDRELGALRRENRRLAVRAACAAEGLVPVERVERARDGDVALVASAADARRLRCRPLLVLATVERPPIPDGMPWAPRRSIRVVQRGGEWFVRRLEAERLATRSERSSLLGVVEGYRRERAEEAGSEGDGGEG